MTRAPLGKREPANGCEATAFVARELGVGVRAARRWLSTWAEVVGPTERAETLAGMPTAADLVLLCLAVKAREDNRGRLDEREALRRAGVFLGRPCPATRLG